LHINADADASDTQSFAGTPMMQTGGAARSSALTPVGEQLSCIEQRR
jgi:hypothetical protein